MGGVQSSMLNLELVHMDKENNIIGLRGAVPGVAGRIIEIIVK